MNNGVILGNQNDGTVFQSSLSPTACESNPRTAIQEKFDRLASDVSYWRRRNSSYYYALQRSYFRFLIPPGKRILEVGCRNGDLLVFLNPSEGLGLDLSPKMIEEATRRHLDNQTVKFRVGDVSSALFDEKFDYVIISPSEIGHLQDIEETLLALRKACLPHTRIVISYYNFLWEPILKLAEKCKLKMHQGAQNWLSPEDLKTFLYLSGYGIVKTERRVLIPERIPFLSSFLNKVIAPLPGISKFCLDYFIVARPLPESNLKREYSSTIVVPCLNERGNVEAAVRRLPPFGKHQEIIFVDGHSTDGTQEEIKRVINKYPHKDIKFMIQDGNGKGDAVRKGFVHAKGDILMILDADLTVSPEDLPKFYDALISSKGEFINGSRLVYPMEKQAMRFLNLLGNKFFGWMFSWLLNQRFKDTLCGTKVLLKKDYEHITLSRDYFGNFDPFGDFDLIFGASKLNLHIIEIPIRYRERTYGDTNIQRFRHGWILLKMCLFAFRKLKMI